MPPPTKVLAEPVILIVPEPVTVNPVGAALLNAVVPEAAITSVPPLPKAKVFVPTPTENIAVDVVDESVAVNPFKSNVPLFSVKGLAALRLVVNASSSVTVPLGLSIIKP